MTDTVYLKAQAEEWRAKHDFIEPIAKLLSYFDGADRWWINIRYQTIWKPLTAINKPAFILVSTLHEWNVITYPTDEVTEIGRAGESPRLVLRKHSRGWAAESSQFITKEEAEEILKVVIAAAPLDAMAILGGA